MKLFLLLALFFTSLSADEKLDAMNETKRKHMAWKYPVWCTVDANGKRGWVRKQFLADEPCKQ